MAYRMDETEYFTDFIEREGGIDCEECGEHTSQPEIEYIGIVNSSKQGGYWEWEADVEVVCSHCGDKQVLRLGDDNL